jgi:hypothetical protein
MGEALTRCFEERRTLSFGDNPIANLSDIDHCMGHVLVAAARFDELLHDSNSYLTEQANRDIATSQGVR